MERFQPIIAFTDSFLVEEMVENRKRGFNNDCVIRLCGDAAIVYLYYIHQSNYRDFYLSVPGNAHK